MAELVRRKPTPVEDAHLRVLRLPVPVGEDQHLAGKPGAHDVPIEPMVVQVELPRAAKAPARADLDVIHGPALL